MQVANSIHMNLCTLRVDLHHQFMFRKMVAGDNGVLLANERVNVAVVDRIDHHGTGATGKFLGELGKS